jgi:NADH:ubiquinone oxidoreductase subunit E
VDKDVGPTSSQENNIHVIKVCDISPCTHFGVKIVPQRGQNYVHMRRLREEEFSFSATQVKCRH